MARTKRSRRRRRKEATDRDRAGFHIPVIDIEDGLRPITERRHNSIGRRKSDLKLHRDMLIAKAVAVIVTMANFFYLVVEALMDANCLSIF